MKRRFTLSVVVMAMVISACGGDEGGATTSQSPTTVTSVPTTAPATTTVTSTTTSQQSTTSTAEVTTTTPPESTTTTLAGEPIDFGPAEGDVLMVIGVRYDDVLNLRSGPGADQRILAEIPPTYTDLVALGSTRQLPHSFWIEVDYDGTDGWTHMGYVGYEGETTDSTSYVIDQLGETPTEVTMTALGEVVAGVFVSEDVESDVVQVITATSGDLHEVTYDVIGLADDAVRGVRLHLFAMSVDGGFGLKSVESTAICGRGVDADGVCT